MPREMRRRSMTLTFIVMGAYFIVVQGSKVEDVETEEGFCEEQSDMASFLIKILL